MTSPRVTLDSVVLGELSRSNLDMTPERERAVQVLVEAFGPPRHWQAFPTVQLGVIGQGVGPGLMLLTCREIGTYDVNEMTRLVIAAHRHQVRVSVRPWDPWLDEHEPWMPRLAMYLRRHFRDEFGMRRVEFSELFGRGVLAIMCQPYPEGSLMGRRHPDLGDLEAIVGEQL